MTFRRDWFSEIQPSQTDEEVSLSDGRICKVLGRGTVHIKRLVKNQWCDGRLENVLYVPSVDKNLFSLGMSMNKNFRVVFKQDSVYFFRDNALKAWNKTEQ